MSERNTRQLSAIMFTDIVGYSAMMHADEKNGRKIAKHYRQTLEGLVGEHRGKVIQHYGDGSLCIFSSAIEAVACAQNIQIRLKEEPVVPLRVGIHLGDIVIDGKDIYGDGVNIASRVESMGVPGSILLTERILFDIKSHPEYTLCSLGFFSFKNIAKPMEVFALDMPGFPIPDRQKLKGKAKAVHPSRLTRTGILALFGLLLALLVIQAVSTYKKGLFQDQKSHTARVAVIPFDNLSGDVAQNYFVEGMTQTLIANLGKVSTLRVIMSQSGNKVKDVSLSLSALGKALQVDAIINGSVIREGNLVRITAQMIDVSSNELIWSETFDRDIVSILKLHSEVAQAIVHNIKVAVTPQELTLLKKAREVDPQAYELLLKGMYHLYKLTPNHYEIALGYFNAALKQDSLNAQAHAGLALLWVHLGQWGGKDPLESAELAREYALKALLIDKDLPMAHQAMAHIYTSYDWNWEAAVASYKKAISLNQNLAEPRLFYADLLLSLHQQEEAMYQIEVALSLDSLNAFSKCMKGWALFSTQQYAKAIISLTQSIITEPSISLSHRCLWSTYHIKGQYDLALKYAILFYRTQDLHETANDLEHAAKEMGYLTALRIAGDRLAERSKERYVSSMRVARLYTFSGHKALALDWLEKAYEEHYISFFSLNVDPHWQSLYDQPRFLDLLEKTQLTLPHNL